VYKKSKKRNEKGERSSGKDGGGNCESVESV